MILAKLAAVLVLGVLIGSLFNLRPIHIAALVAGLALLYIGM